MHFAFILSVIDFEKKLFTENYMYMYINGEYSTIPISLAFVHISCWQLKNLSYLNRFKF